MHGRQHGDDATFGDHPAWQWALRLSLALALVLGAAGYWLNQPPADRHAGHALYHALQLFILHAPHFDGDIPLPLEIARWLAPLSSAGGLATLLLRSFREELRRRRLRELRGHVVICGLGRKGMELARHLRRAEAPQRPDVVVLDKDPPHDLAAECESLGAQLLAADATRAGALRTAGIARAASVYALCPEDATNCEIAAQVAQLLDACGGSGLDCYVHLDAAELGQTLQQALPPGLGSSRVRLHAVDAFDPEAIALLVHGLPLDHGSLAAGDPRGVRLVILGFGRMGRALAVRAAQLGQFANGRRLRIEVIDRQALRNRDALFFHHPHIGQAADLAFHEHEAASPAVRELVEGFCRDRGWHTSIVIAFDNEPLALEVCLRLAPAFDSDTVRVAVRLEHDGGLARLLDRLRARESGSALARLQVFGTSRQFVRLSDPEAWPLEKFARQFHAAYVRLRLEQAGGDPRRLEECRQKPELQEWSRLPHDLQDSDRLAAAHIFIKLRALGCEAVPEADPRPAITRFEDADAHMLAKLEHQRWCAERRVAGWVFGETKDVPGRRNPSLVEWERLTPEVRQLDFDSVARIPAILASAGLKVVRRA